MAGARGALATGLSIGQLHSPYKNKQCKINKTKLLNNKGHLKASYKLLKKYENDEHNRRYM